MNVDENSKAKKVSIWKWIASAFLWLLSPSWASSLWEKWRAKNEEKDVYPPPPKKENKL